MKTTNAPVKRQSEIVRVLMRRDGGSFEDVIAEIEAAKEFCVECNFDYNEIEQYFLDELCLEMDYVEEVIYFNKDEVLNPFQTEGRQN